MGEPSGPTAPRLDQSRFDGWPKGQSITTTSPNRDPRLALRQQGTSDGSRPPPSGPPPGGPPVSDSVSSPFGQTLIESLGQLTMEIVAIANAQDEHAKLKKAHAALQELHEKSKNMSQFPSTVAIFQQNNKEYAQELSRVEQKLETHRRQRKYLEDMVATMINAHFKRGSVPDAKVEQICSEAKSALATAKDLKDELSSMRNEVETLRKAHDGKIEKVDEQVKEVSSLAASHTQDVQDLKYQFSRLSDELQQFSTKAQERLDKLEKEQTWLKIVPDLRGDHDKLEKRVGKVEAQLQSTPANHISQLDEQLNRMEKSAASTEAVKKADDAIEDVKGRITALEEGPMSAKAFESCKVALEDIENRLKGLESIRSPSSVATNPKYDQSLSKLQAQVDHLKDHFEKLLDMVSLSDDCKMAAIEEAEKNLSSRLNPLVDNVKDDCNKAVQRLEASLESQKEALQKQLKLQSKSIEGLRDTIEHHGYKDEIRKAIEESERRLETKLKPMIEATDETAKQLKASIESQANDLGKRCENQSLSIEGLRKDIVHRDSRLQTVETAIVSLESRYNHLTTEPIVRHAVSVLHELYPSPQTLQVLEGQISALQTRVSQINVPDVSGLSTSLESLKQNHANLAEEVRKNHTNCANECQRLADQHASVVQQVEKQQQDIAVAKEGLASLEKNMPSEEDMKQAILQEVNQQRDHVLKQIKSLEKQLSEARAETTDKLKALGERIQAANADELEKIYEQVREMKGFVSDQIQAVDNRLDNFKEESRRDVQDAIARLQDLERAKEELVERLTSEPETLTLRPVKAERSEPSGVPDDVPLAKEDTPLASPMDANEAAKHNAGKKKKRKFNSSALISDEGSATSNTPSARSSPVPEEGSSQLSRSEKKHKKKKRKKKHLASGSTPVVALDD